MARTSRPLVRATLVAFYGEKRAELLGCLQSLQGLVDSMVAGFDPYALPQVHATLVGMEGYLARHRFILNANYLEGRGQLRVVRAARLLDTLHAYFERPIEIQIGGFAEATPYGFESRGQHPHLRSLSVQGERVVVMGWPRTNDTFPRTLARLRREIESAGVLHKYHTAAAASDDNDLYFVLGTLAQPRSRQLQAMLTAGRKLMAEQPLRVRLGIHDLQLVSYRDRSLQSGGAVAHELAQLDPSALVEIGTCQHL